MSLRTLMLRRPDDWHLHLRDGAMLASVAPASADVGRALVMPNLAPPVVTAADARAYRDRILAVRPAFTPLMTLYLTEETGAGDVAAAHAEGLIAAVKLYPAGATTNSHAGVRDMDRVAAVLERMADIGLPLCVHGEVTDPAVDIFDREAVFLDRVLAPLAARLPSLRIVLEHVTTEQGLDFVRAHAPRMAGTITAHHLIIERNHILAGGIRPHYYCLPVAKRARHRDALRAAAASGEGCFFHGSDSAPHLDALKLAPCGCAGCFTAPVALACLAEVFDAMGALDRLEAFTSLNGAAFYGLAPNAQSMTLEWRDTPWTPPAQIAAPDGFVTVFDPGFPLHWRPAGDRP